MPTQAAAPALGLWPVTKGITVVPVTVRQPWPSWTPPPHGLWTESALKLLAFLFLLKGPPKKGLLASRATCSVGTARTPATVERRPTTADVFMLLACAVL